MILSRLLSRMTAYSNGNFHDINHFLKVWAYARAIGLQEQPPPEVQTTLEAAAIVHDIACPLCREKYGSTHGPYQEAEGAVLAAEFLQDSGLSQSVIDRVVYLVGHHHTYTGVDGADYQILLEADYLVNAEESGYTPEAIRSVRETVFKTAAGTALLDSLYFPE